MRRSRPDIAKIRAELKPSEQTFHAPGGKMRLQSGVNKVPAEKL
jgi:hypothetical protein